VNSSGLARLAGVSSAQPEPIQSSAFDELDRAEAELPVVHQSHAIPCAQHRFLRNIRAAFAETDTEQRFGKPRLYMVFGRATETPRQEGLTNALDRAGVSGYKFFGGSGGCR
jgi:hypothetical protein